MGHIINQGIYLTRQTSTVNQSKQNLSLEIIIIAQVTGYPYIFEH